MNTSDRAEPSPAPSPLDHPLWHSRFSEAVRLIVAPLITLWSGFFTAEFLLSGYYTWPRTSRVLALTLTVAILSYEFLYKEQRSRQVPPAHGRALRAVLLSCLAPYGIGFAAFLMIVLVRH